MAKGNITLIKEYFERADAQAPTGGRKCEIPEMKALSAEDRVELGRLAAAELGEEVTTDRPVAVAVAA
jgi:hypothetical protein